MSKEPVEVARHEVRKLADGKLALVTIGRNEAGNEAGNDIELAVPARGFRIIAAEATRLIEEFEAAEQRRAT